MSSEFTSTLHLKGNGNSHSQIHMIGYQEKIAGAVSLADRGGPNGRRRIAAVAER
jgi:hypothetical protein